MGSDQIPAVLRNLTWLDFLPEKDCEIAGRFLGAWSNALDDNSTTQAAAPLMFDFARACAPVPLGNISYEDIVLWNSFNFENHLLSAVNLTNQTNERCHNELCQNLKFEGNPDLAGVGIFIGYSIQLGLAIIFFTICLVQYIKGGFSGDDNRPGGDEMGPQTPTTAESTPLNDIGHTPVVSQGRLRSPRQFDKCFDVFWDSSIYFCFAVSTAAIIIVGIQARSPRTVRAYSAIFSIPSTLFASSIVGYLWTRRRRRVRGIGLEESAFIAMVVLGVIFPSIIIVHPSTTQDAELIKFEQLCFKSLPAVQFFTSSTWVIAFVCLMLSTFLLGFTLNMWWASAFRLFARFLRVIIPVLSILSAVGSIIFMGLIRTKVSEIVGYEVLADNEWAFGQLVAILAWFPTLYTAVAPYIPVHVWTWEQKEENVQQRT